LTIGPYHRPISIPLEIVNRAIGQMSASASLLVTTSQLAVLIEVAECFDADGLVAAADADRRKTSRRYQFCNRPAGFRIVRRIEKNDELWLAVCRRFERLNTYVA
jgi:hypothetical protein